MYWVATLRPPGEINGSAKIFLYHEDALMWIDGKPLDWFRRIEICHTLEDANSEWCYQTGKNDPPDPS
jgi:hypothetical protein